MDKFCHKILFLIGNYLGLESYGNTEWNYKRSSPNVAENVQGLTCENGNILFLNFH